MNERKYPRDLYRTREFPILLNASDCGEYGAHESLFRSYQILKHVKDMLRDRVPYDYILLLIGVMDGEDLK